MNPVREQKPYDTTRYDCKWVWILVEILLVAASVNSARSLIMPKDFQSPHGELEVMRHP